MADGGSSPPAPEPGASHVRSDTSTVLAQVFTAPFIVFSAKKFPGVPGIPRLYVFSGRIF